MNVLVTGGAGSIGVYVVRALLARGDAVTIVDSFNDFYDPAFKRHRLEVVLAGMPSPHVVEANIADADALAAAFTAARPEAVIHLAAWPGVRLSLQRPLLYTRENVDGTVNVFEESAKQKVKNVVFASSSSVYGRAKPPFREDARCDAQVSPYGASKRAGELFAAMYHHAHGLPVVCLRFFTVYGPWIRPDMALWTFTERIQRHEPITLHRRSADGTEVKRDFTHVRDIVQGVLAALDRNRGFDIINLSARDPVPLTRFIRAIEAGLGTSAVINEHILPPEEEVATAADITKAERQLGYHPTVKIEDGAKEFADWYVREFLPAFPTGLAPSAHV
jgi:UDP-glucuronate 4-epimerase